MKKMLLAIGALLALASAASAAPYVVSDSFTADMVDDCVVILDGVEYRLAPVPTGDGVSARCEVDVGPVANGSHSLTLYTENMWGVSDQVPFAFTKELPPSLQNIRLEN